MSSFWNRTIFGALYIVVLVFSITNGVYTFGLVFFGLSLFTVNEFCNLISQTGTNLNKKLVLPLTALIFIFSFLSAFLIYVAVPFAILNFLCVYKGNYTYQLLIPIFILIWANDTFAYLTGITIGRTKFFESISPKKTWEGTIGGIIFTMVFGYFLNHYFTILTGKQWMLIAMVVSFFGIIGDLVESMLKRNLGIKDSGFFLPGHGGFLDRFDSFIFAVPFVYVVISWFNL